MCGEHLTSFGKITEPGVTDPVPRSRVCVNVSQMSILLLLLLFVLCVPVKINVLAGNSVKGFNLELNPLEVSPLMVVLCVGA